MNPFSTCDGCEYQQHLLVMQMHGCMKVIINRMLFIKSTTMVDKDRE